MIAILLASLMSSLSNADQMNWSAGTAHTLPKGRYEVGLFGPLRVGLANGNELQVHPGWFFVSPHMTVKKDVLEIASWNLGVRQTATYPTLLLRGLAREGIGGILPADSDVPHIIASDSAILLTKSASTDYDLTFWGEMSLALAVGESNWPTIDSPLGYYQTAVYQHGLGLSAGMLVTGKAIDRLYYKSELSFSVVPFAGTVWSESDDVHAGVPDATGTWIMTEASSLIYRFSDGLQAQVGFRFTYGDYPYGRNWHLLPTADLVFGW